MSVDNYFIYLIEAMKKKEYEINGISHLTYLMYLSIANSKKGFNEIKIKFNDEKTMITIPKFRHHVLNFHLSLSSYLSYYKKHISFKDISDYEKRSIDEIVDIFGKFKVYQLMLLVEYDIFENNGFTPFQIGKNKNKDEISHKDIRNYYSKKYFKIIKDNLLKTYEILI